MKKISETMQIGIAIVGLAIAYATFSGKGKGEGGTGGGGGGLDIPFIPDLSGFFGTAPASAPAESSLAIQPTSDLISSGLANIAAASQKKTVGGSSVSPSFFFASTTPTYEYGADPTKPYSSTNPNEIAKKAENIAYTNTRYGQLGESVLGSQYTEKKLSAPAVLTNTMGGSSSNKGGTWVGSTFYRGKYT